MLTDCDFCFKVAVVGDSGTGKKDLISKFTRNECYSSEAPEIARTAYRFERTTVEINEKKIKAEIWNTGGGRSRNRSSQYYSSVVGAVIVYDITSRLTFQSVEDWLRQLKDVAVGDDIRIMLIGNKCDLSHLSRAVSIDEGKQFADEHSLKFFETSCVESINVEFAFLSLLTDILTMVESKKAQLASASAGKDEEKTTLDVELHANKRLSKILRSMSVVRKAKGAQEKTDQKIQNRPKSEFNPKIVHSSMQPDHPPTRSEGPVERFEAKERVHYVSMIQLQSDRLAELQNKFDMTLKRFAEDKFRLQMDKALLHDELQQLKKGKNEQFQQEIDQLQKDKQLLEQNVKKLECQVSQYQCNWKVSHKDVTMTNKELGRGGWGVIWIGQFREQRVAVKQMHSIIASEINLDMLRREIDTMANLRHPNLLQFIGAVFDHPSGNPMIITEIMDTSLRKAYEDKLLTPAQQPLQCISIMRDVAVRLNYLHCLPEPIIHRDVSSANVLLESKGRGKWKTKISDFGSANKAKQAITGAVGAIVYSAPEALQNVTLNGRKNQTVKLDVFSYGVLLCEVLNCRFPYVDSFKEMLKHVKVAFGNSRKELIESCLSEKPEIRPTMKQVIKHLDS